MRVRKLCVVSLLVMVGTGCDGTADLDPTIGTAGPTDTDRPIVPTSPATGVRLSVAELDSERGYLTDSRGVPLYVRLNRESQRACDEVCATYWPTLTATRAPAEAGVPDVQPDLIGTVLREDGTLQVTYADRPLHYRNAPALEPAEVRVSDQWGEWALVSPRGEPLER